MKNLVISQAAYLWHCIKKRVVIWISLWIIVLVVMSKQLQPSSLNLVQEVFDGISFSEIETHVLKFPVMWFVCFFGPELVFLNSINEAQVKREIIFRGMRFSPLKLAVSHLMEIIFFSIGYSVISIGAIFLLEQKVTANLIKVGIMISIGTLFLLLLQVILGQYLSLLGIVVPLVLLVGTAYLPIKWNPLNYLMLARQGRSEILLKAVTLEVIIFMVNSIKGEVND